MSSWYRLLDDAVTHSSERERVPRSVRSDVRGRTLLRGVVAGVGGTAVSTLWLLAVDLGRGLPFDTAATLCAYVTRAFGSSGWRGTTQLATLFTGLECGAFVLAGVLAATAARRVDGRALGVLAATVVALVAVAVPLAALYVVTSHQVADDLWGHVLAAHLAAVALMAMLLWQMARAPRAPDRTTTRHDPAAPGPVPAPASPEAGPATARPTVRETGPSGGRSARKRRRRRGTHPPRAHVGP
ncbi:hypothetical protein [Roseisolibacter sp. H3M3-2]|uniref:hypothetical protein n=1 Tax=Roseisolibacter sp. H3M3-2 TaxID=3031323 RepID=UPI0023D9FC82|nr:hypothetical protein [Roseisolibacter sp. H3M3-2]MDF1501336.1 hypothetical protein [Roseisolibacter sp. H3M3-2]